MPGISRRALLKADGGGVLSAYLLAAEAQTRPAHASPAADQLPLEDGYRLWLRYQPVAHRERRLEYERAFTQIVRRGNPAVLRAAESELVCGLTGLLARSVPAASAPT